MTAESFTAQLSAIRADYVDTYKQYAPDWLGESYPTWEEYPAVPDVPEANDARSAVQHIDSLLWIWENTRSTGGHALTGDQLIDFAECFATLQGIVELRLIRPVFSAGVKRIHLSRKGGRPKRIK